MGWFALMFPAEASEKARLQAQVQQMQQQMDLQAGLIARMHATLIHLRAENAVLSNNAGAFLERKVERFQAAAAAMLRDSDNILQRISGAGPGKGGGTRCWSLTNNAPPPGSTSREHLEAIRRAASDIRQSNYASVIGAPDVKDAISALEMWADTPCIGQLLLAAYILSMGSL